MTTNTRIKTSADTQVSTQDVLSKSAVYATGGAAAIIGLWAAACFVGALISSGPVELFTGWFKAVSGF